MGGTSQSSTPKPYTSTALLILPSLISSGGMWVIYEQQLSCQLSARM